MVNSRYKPVGWCGESHRHYLAARGVRTGFRSLKYTTIPGKIVTGGVERFLAERRAKRRVDEEFAGLDEAQQLALQRRMLRTNLSGEELERQKDMVEELRAARRSVGVKGSVGVGQAYDFLAKNESERKVRLKEVEGKITDVSEREQVAKSLKDEDERNRVLPKVLQEKNDLLDERRVLVVEILRTQREMRKLTRKLAPDVVAVSR